MNAVLEKIEKIGIVPVVVLNDAKDAEPLAKALCNGGLPCAEVTFRTAAAEESIRIMSEKYPEMLVGAGTVLTTEQVDRAVAAGAKFIVSPGLNPKVVQYCLDKNIPVTPGTQTPSEMEQALEMGLDVVKFFPAEPAGGLKMIKAVAAPYTTLKFMPTGGINLENVEEYLKYDRILACGGSWMVKGDLVSAGKFDEIEKMTESGFEDVTRMRSAAIFYECLPLGVDKSRGFAELIKILGAEKRFSVASGDYKNDAAMIKNANLGVAVANALDEVKAAADLVVCDNNSAPISEVIEYLEKLQ